MKKCVSSKYELSETKNLIEPIRTKSLSQKQFTTLGVVIIKWDVSIVIVMKSQ
jgi:hypothetical protein